MLKKIFLILIFVFQWSIGVDYYNHETFILTNAAKESFALPEKTKEIAINTNYFLNYSKFFDSRLISNAQEAQRELAKDPAHKEFVIETEDKQRISCSFMDRGMDNIIIVGPGFTNFKEKMIPFFHMFTGFDVLIMNFRGHGYKNEICLNPLYHCTGVDSSIKLGAAEEKDVFAVINYVRKYKKYENVIGLGICFGAFIFAKAQSISEKANFQCFDKIILDGCWPSLTEFIEKIKDDPYLIVDPQNGGISREVKWLFNRSIVINLILQVIKSFLGVDIPSLDIRSYLKQIHKTPVLFFYGKDDLTISRHHFEDLFKCTSTKEKFAVITSNPHVLNHLKSKELYKLIVELFIHANVKQVTRLLANPKKLKNVVLEIFEKRLSISDIQLYKPSKLLKKNNIFNIIRSYKWHSIVATTLGFGYRFNKIKQATLSKLIYVYLFFKLIQFGWRPIISLFIT